MQEGGNANDALIDRLGGNNAVRKIVEIFNKKVQANPRLASFVEGTDIGWLRARQSAFLMWMFSNGKQTFAGRDMRCAHLRLIRQRGFAPEDWDAGTAAIRESLREMGAPEGLIKDIMHKLAPYRDIVFTPGSLDDLEAGRWAADDTAKAVRSRGASAAPSAAPSARRHAPSVSFNARADPDDEIAAETAVPLGRAGSGASAGRCPMGIRGSGGGSERGSGSGSGSRGVRPATPPQPTSARPPSAACPAAAMAQVLPAALPPPPPPSAALGDSDDAEHDEGAMTSPFKQADAEDAPPSPPLAALLPAAAPRLWAGGSEALKLTASSASSSRRLEHQESNGRTARGGSMASDAGIFASGWPSAMTHGSSGQGRGGSSRGMSREGSGEAQADANGEAPPGALDEDAAVVERFLEEGGFAACGVGADVQARGQEGLEGIAAS